jgi:hypothetical protein
MRRYLVTIGNSDYPMVFHADDENHAIEQFLDAIQGELIVVDKGEVGWLG